GFSSSTIMNHRWWLIKTSQLKVLTLDESLNGLYNVTVYTIFAVTHSSRSTLSKSCVPAWSPKSWDALNNTLKLFLNVCGSKSLTCLLMKPSSRLWTKPTWVVVAYSNEPKSPTSKNN